MAKGRPPAGRPGPRGSFVVPLEYDWHLLVGDESALPAIARRLEELPPGKPVIALIEVADPAARLALSTRAQASVQWLLREPAPAAVCPGRARAAPAAGRRLRLGRGRGGRCARGAAGAGRHARAGQSRIRAASYWKRGEAAVHETHD